MRSKGHRRGIFSSELVEDAQKGWNFAAVQNRFGHIHAESQ